MGTDKPACTDNRSCNTVLSLATELPRGIIDNLGRSLEPSGLRPIKTYSSVDGQDWSKTDKLPGSHTNLWK